MIIIIHTHFIHIYIYTYIYISLQIRHIYEYVFTTIYTHIYIYIYIDIRVQKLDRLLRSENMCPGDGVEESPCAVHHALARPVEVRFGEGFRGPQWGDGRSVKTILYPEKKNK